MFTWVSRGKGEENRARMVGGLETKGGGSLAKPKARLPVVCTKVKGSFKELNQISTSPCALFPQPLGGKHFTATNWGGGGEPRAHGALLHVPKTRLHPLHWGLNRSHPSPACFGSFHSI